MAKEQANGLRGLTQAQEHNLLNLTSVKKSAQAASVPAAAGVRSAVTPNTQQFKQGR